MSRSEFYGGSTSERKNWTGARDFSIVAPKSRHHRGLHSEFPALSRDDTAVDRDSRADRCAQLPREENESSAIDKS